MLENQSFFKNFFATHNLHNDTCDLWPPPPHQAPPTLYVVCVDFLPLRGSMLCVCVLYDGPSQQQFWSLLCLQCSAHDRKLVSLRGNILILILTTCVTHRTHVGFPFCKWSPSVRNLVLSHARMGRKCFLRNAYYLDFPAEEVQIVHGPVVLNYPHDSQ